MLFITNCFLKRLIIYYFLVKVYVSHSIEPPIPLFFSGKVIEGRLTNNGDQKLSLVKILIVYTDKKGKQLFEETRMPVIYTEKHGSRDDILEPGSSMNFSFIASSEIPDDWESEIQITVTDVEFFDDLHY